MSSDWLLVIGGFVLLLGGGEVVVQGCLLYTSDAADE